MKLSSLSWNKINRIIYDRVFYYKAKLKRRLLDITCIFLKIYTLKYKHINIKLNISSRWDLDRATGGYDDFVIKQIDDIILRKGKNQIYYEIGACNAINSLIVAKLTLENNGLCLAFEPSPADIKNIASNIKLNGLGNIFLMPFAVSNATKLLKLYYCKPNIISGQGGHSLLSRFSKKECEFINIPTFKLDDAVKYFNLPCPTIISIDVEGNEENVINGMKDVLMEGDLKNIIIEVLDVLDPKKSKITEILKENGFEVKDFFAAPQHKRKHCMVNYQRI